MDHNPDGKFIYNGTCRKLKITGAHCVKKRLKMGMYYVYTALFRRFLPCYHRAIFSFLQSHNVLSLRQLQRLFIF